MDTDKIKVFGSKVSVESTAKVSKKYCNMNIYSNYYVKFINCFSLLNC